MTATITNEKTTGQAIGYLPNVPLLAIAGDPANERGQLAPDDLQDLAASIKERGVLEPVRVYPDAHGYVLISGHRRLAAAWIAGLESIPAIVVKPPEAALWQAIDRLTSNLQREDLSDMEVARSLQTILQDNEDLTQEQLATQLGLSQSRISNLLRLFQLPPEVQQMIGSGKLTTGHGLALLKLKEPVLDWYGNEMQSGEQYRLSTATRAAESGWSVESLNRVVTDELRRQESIRQGIEDRRRREEEIKAREQTPQGLARKAADEAELAETKARIEREEKQKRQRPKVAWAAIDRSLAWDESKGPGLELLRVALRVIAGSIYSYQGTTSRRGIPKQYTDLERQIAEADGRQLSNLLVRLVVSEIRLNYSNSGLDTYGPSKLFDQAFNLTPAVRAALIEASLLEEEKKP